MKTKDEVKERAMDLALKYGNTSQIARILESQGFGSLLDQFELEAIVMEAKAIRGMLPDRKRKTLPWITGLIAVIMGVYGMWIGMGGSSVRYYALGEYGIAAVILGFIFILWPSSAKTNI
jgi:hypothetical protein